MRRRLFSKRSSQVPPGRGTKRCIGQHALGIAERSHDQPRLQFISRNQRLLDVLVRRRLLSGDEPRAHVDAAGAGGESGQQTARIGHAAGRHKRDLEFPDSIEGRKRSRREAVPKV